MDDFLDDFPTLERANKAIEKLQNTKWPTFDSNLYIEEFVEKVENIILHEFGVMPFTVKLFKPNEFKLGIFRVREVDSFTNINLFTEHSYPPVHLSGFGRCNFPKHPVFYCSNDPLTALIEVVREGDYKKKKYCISSWELIDTPSEFVFTTFLQSELHQENHFEFIKNAEVEQLYQVFENKLNEDRKSGLIEYLKFLHGSFINDKYYSLSASLAHRAIYANHTFSTDILMYPSTQTQYKGVNMAIHPNFVDNRMQVQRFYIVEIENYNPENGKFNITFSNYGKIEKSVCLWKNLDPNDEEYKNYFLKDFSHLLGPNFKFVFNEPKNEE